MTTGLLPPLDRRSVLLFAGLLVLLLAPWPRWGRAFGTLFCAYGNALLALGGSGSTPPRFEVPAPGVVSAADGGQWAVALTDGDRVAPLDTRIIAYTPLALFLALALATPVARRRKLFVLGAGGALMLARLAFAVLVPLGGAGAAGSVRELAWTVLIAAPVMSYAAPLAVWWATLAVTTPRPVTASARSAKPTRRRARATARRA